MAAQFGVSTFGRQIVLSEGHPPSAVRIAFVVVTLILGTLAILNAIRLFIRLINRRGKRAASNVADATGTPALVVFTYAVFILNLLIHTLHYADNIYRPVDYYEPKWLYLRYLLETMEITFAVNFPISIGGSLALARLFSFEKDQLLISRNACYGMFGFIFGSLLTLLHYRTEPPTSYSWPVNVTIAGEGVVAIIMLVAVVLCLMTAAKQQPQYNYEAIRVESENLNEEGEEEQIKGAAIRRSSRSPRRSR